MRWDGDERGHGVADASQSADGAAELVAAMRRPSGSLPLQILAARTSDDGSYDVQLAWSGGEAGVGAVRAAVFALLGTVAEPASYVRQRRTEGDAALTFEVVTGILDAAPFEPHGHTLRLNVASGLR